MKAKQVTTWVKTAFAAVLAIPFLAPFFFMVTVSLKTSQEYVISPIGFPKTITFEHIINTWQKANLGNALFNSLYVSIVAVFVATILSLSAAYWFIHFNQKWTTKLRGVMMFGYSFPAVIWLIPLFVIMARNGYTNNLTLLGLIYGVSNLPFGLYLMYTFYKQTLKSEILEAAKIDGAGILATFARIAVPLTLPALGAISTLVFVWSFGDLLFAVTLLQDPTKWTMPMAAATLVSSQRITAQAQAAAACVSLLPSLVLVIFTQKSLVRGFGGGAVKE